MLTVTLDFINAVIVTFTMMKCTEILLDRTIKIDKKTIGLIIINSLGLTINYLIMQDLIKVIFTFIDLIIFNKLITKDITSKCVIVTFIEYLNTIITETILGLVLGVVLTTLDIDIINLIRKTVVINTLVMGINYLFIYEFRKFYRRILLKMEDNSLLYIIILTLSLLLCVGAVFYKADYTDWKLTWQLIGNIAIILTMCIIAIVTIYQRVKYEKVNKQYEDLAKFSEINATLVEDYSVLNHEYKNQLIIIKGMIGKKNKDVHEYIDSLISERKGITSQWIIELNNISFMGLRSFMNHKILEMRSKGLNANVVISKDCKNINLEALPTEVKKSIYSIVGVYLDNAMEAALLSEEKMVAINAYTTNKNQICLEIANTFSGEVELNKINTYGYSSKGTGRGTGLYIVNKLIKEHDCLESNTIIEHGYFIQKLIITQKK